MRSKPFFFLFLIFFLIIFQSFQFVISTPSNLEYTFQDTSGFYGINSITNSSNLRFQQIYTYNYNATYTFDNDVGFDPDGWTISEGSGSSIIGIATKSGHDSVIELYSSGNSYSMSQTFSNQESGTLEFWFYITTTTAFQLYLGQAGSQIQFRTYLNYFDTYYSGAWHHVCSYAINTWYHVRIDFECGAGGYKGLTADHLYFYLNGQIYGSFAYYTAISYINKIEFLSYGVASQYVYLDAIGYSWDVFYEIGDNTIPLTELSETLEVGAYNFEQNATNDHYTLGSIADDYLPFGFYTYGVDKTVEISKTGGKTDNNEDDYCLNCSTSSGNDFYLMNAMSFNPVNIVEFNASITLFLETSSDVFSFELSNPVGFVYDRANLGVEYDGSNMLLYAGSDTIAVSYSNNFTFSFQLLLNKNFYIVNFEVGGVLYRFYEHSAYDMFDGSTDFGIRMQLSPVNDASFQLNSIGAYNDGKSMNVDEYGYFEIVDSNLETMEGFYISLFGTLQVSKTSYNYKIGNAITPFFYFDTYTNVFHYSGVYGNNTFLLTLKGVLDDFSIDNGFINMYKNGVFEIKSESVYGSQYVNSSLFYVQNSVLFGYCVSNDTDVSNEYIKLTFDLNDFDVTGYILTVNDLFTTNLNFNTFLTLKYLDQSVDNIVIDNKYSYDYSLQMVKYKWLTDVFLTIIPLVNSSQNESTLSGFESLQFNYIGIPTFSFTGAGLLGTFIPILIIIAPTLLIYTALELKTKSYGKKVIIPLIMLISVIIYASGNIPLWLFFVIMLVGGSIILMNRRRKPYDTTDD